MTETRRYILNAGLAACVAPLGAVLTACDDPKAKIKDLKSLVQVNYGAKKFKESGANAQEGLKLALETVGPKHPDTLYFAQAVSEAYLQLGDKSKAMAALDREIELRLGAGQTESKLQSRRTYAIKFAEELGDRKVAARHALAIARAIEMGKGKDPQPVYRPETKYPRDLFAQGIEGDVTVTYSLDAEGAVTNAKVVKATPKDLFDDAAIDSFMSWRFTPMLENGKPVPTSGHQYTLMFRLGGRAPGARN
ncbi:MAG: TonB family protein [Rhodospirillaceae bacterium]|nr:TonB family protein [Rhodospirillaceae bacterium]